HSGLPYSGRGRGDLRRRCGAVHGLSCAAALARLWLRLSALLSCLRAARLSGALFLALFAAGRIDAGMLTLIGSPPPIFTLCPPALVGAERITAIRVFGILLGAISVAFLILPQASLVGVTAVTAMVAALGIPLSYSSYHVYLSKHWPAGSDSFQVA